MNRHALPCLVLALTAVIAMSGCVNTGLQTGSGITIQEFTPGLSEIYPGEGMTFFLKFKNIGSVEATDVFAELLGLDEDWAASSSSDSIGGNMVVSNEVLPREAQCQYTSTGSHFNLKPPDMTYGTEGESATCTWKYRAPPIPEGFRPTYDITARVFYTYRTDLVKSFTMLSTEELMRYNQQGRAIPSSTVSSTRSPVTITTKARDPVRFWGDSVTFPLAITFSNTGGGMTCLKGMCRKATSGDSGWNKLEYSIKEVSKGITIDCFDHAEEIDVWPNRDNTIICGVTVSDLSSIVDHEERIIGISAEYSYFTDAGASITIL